MTPPLRAQRPISGAPRRLRPQRALCYCQVWVDSFSQPERSDAQRAYRAARLCEARVFCVAFHANCTLDICCTPMGTRPLSVPSVSECRAKPADCKKKNTPDISHSFISELVYCDRVGVPHSEYRQILKNKCSFAMRTTSSSSAAVLRPPAHTCPGTLDTAPLVFCRTSRQCTSVTEVTKQLENYISKCRPKIKNFQLTNPRG